MKRWRRWLAGAVVAVLETCAVRPAAAAPCTEAVGLPEGRTPTCAGVLVPTEWAVEHARLKRVDLPRCRADLQAMQAERDLLRHDLGQLRALNARRAWYEAPGFWTAVGLVGGIALTVSVVKAVQQ